MTTSKEIRPGKGCVCGGGGDQRDERGYNYNLYIYTFSADCHPPLNVHVHHCTR